jgi:sulfoxide reductase heme-binding subunit YedZ
VLRRRDWLVLLVAGAAVWPWAWLLLGDPFAAANPAQYLLDCAGLTATAFLVGVLSLSPLRALAPRSRLAAALNRHRRFLGVTAFGFAALHVVYFWFHVGGLAGALREIDKPFIWSGLAAFAVLAALAATSFDAAVRAFGPRRWKGLHRAAYVAAALVFYHQAAQQRVGASEALWLFLPLAGLQLARLWQQWRPRARRQSAGPE